MTNPRRLGVDDRATLQKGVQLDDRFRIERTINADGGFGVTYLAFDKTLDVSVAVREFLPAELAQRTPDGRTVEPISSSRRVLFERGLDQFLNEARALSKI